MRNKKKITRTKMEKKMQIIFFFLGNVLAYHFPMEEVKERAKNGGKMGGKWVREGFEIERPHERERERTKNGEVRRKKKRPVLV